MDFSFGLTTQAGCKSPFFSKADLFSKFLEFADAPDELTPVISYEQLPCPKGKKASKKCREKNGESEDENPPSKTEANNGSPSKTEESSHYPD
jgi:hypothetical protein